MEAWEEEVEKTEREMEESERKLVAIGKKEGIKGYIHGTYEIAGKTVKVASGNGCANVFVNGTLAFYHFDNGLVYNFLKSLSVMTPADMGRKGGSVKSPAKARSAAENGRKGGRPKKHLE